MSSERERQVITISLEDLDRDPLLPPRIIQDQKLDELADSMRQHGLLEPIVVRPAEPRADARHRYSIILGNRRVAAAARLGWTTIEAVISGGSTDQEVICQAFDAECTVQHRSKLEMMWLYAAMKKSGIRQVAIARKGKFSEAKASMYIKIGRRLSPERILAAGVDLHVAASLAVITLDEIASGPDDQLEQRLVEAVRPASDQKADDEQDAGRRPGRGRADTGRAGEQDEAVSTHKDRRGKTDVAGAPDAESSDVENGDDSAIQELRERLTREFEHERLRLVEEHRLEVIRLREEHQSRVERLVERVATLSLALVRLREHQGQQPESTSATTVVGRLRAWLRRLGGAESSIIEDPGSTTEAESDVDDAQIRFQFTDEAA